MPLAALLVLLGYRADIPPESMTIDSFVADLDDVLGWLRKRFGERKMTLFGHSWGSAVGTICAARQPDKVSVYVGIGQIVSAMFDEVLPLARAERS